MATPSGWLPVEIEQRNPKMVNKIHTRAWKFLGGPCLSQRQQTEPHNLLPLGGGSFADIDAADGGHEPFVGGEEEGGRPVGEGLVNEAMQEADVLGRSQHAEDVEGAGLQKPDKGKGKQNVVDEDSDSWSDEIFDDSDDNFEGLGEDVSDESDFDIETMLEDRTDDD
ncbi:hypothetical protein VNO77_00294 [Canavalia gladiata]|uniref:Uncharacterized protein n=1 Tax=Canavalia gladiata TaxID=3824 RepID=A0AAN9R3V8_CANGL